MNTDNIERLYPRNLRPHPKNSREPLLVIAASAHDDVQARVLESRHCHMHRDTILNIHDPAKGAKDL